jgi:ferric-dicitrate binding protein FerR (iron transport regulator)
MPPSARKVQDEPARPAEPEFEASRDARRRHQRIAVLALLVLLAAAAAVLAGLAARDRVEAWRAARAAMGDAVIESTPAGARVFVDDEERGTTPLTLRLDPRQYAVRLESGALVHAFEITVQPGETATHHLHLVPGNPDRATGTAGASQARTQRGAG